MNFRPMKSASGHAAESRLEKLFYTVFPRIVATVCLWLGLQYWAMLVGYSHGGLARFDLLPAPWRMAAAALAAIFPVAALGLWLKAAWGIVMWALAAGAEIAMFGVWTDIYGHHPAIIGLHAAVALVYAAFRAASLFKDRRKRPTA